MIKHMNYLDIPPDARKEAGLRRLTQLQRTLADRSLPPSHRALVEDEVRRVSAWVNGAITPSLPVAAEADASHHDFTIVVSETVSVNER